MRLIDRRLPPSRWTAAALGLAYSLGLAACNGDGSDDDRFEEEPEATSVAAGDLDGDGRVDLVRLRIFPEEGLRSTLAVFLQQETPREFVRTTNAGSGRDARDVILADLDSDGLLDAAAASQLGPVVLHFQDPGAPGTFRERVDLDARSPRALAFADVDGDGRRDLIAAGTRISSLQVFLQDPVEEGVFLEAVRVEADAIQRGVAPADLDGDGFFDLVAATSAGVAVILQDPARPGAFDPPLTLPAGGRPFDVEVGDLDGDGRPDLVVANAGTSGRPPSISVHLQDPTRPAVFLDPVFYDTGRNTTSVAIGDLDADGEPDVAAASEGSGFDGRVFVFLRDPQRPGELLPPDELRVNELPRSVRIADVDGDGFEDIVVASDGVRVLYQDPAMPGTFERPVRAGG